MAWIRANKWLVLAGGAAVVAAGAWLAFGFFGVHTLFTDDKVDEARPDFATSAPVSDAGDGPTTTVPGEDIAALSGDFVDRSHPTRGQALVLTDGVRRVLRFEGFETDNGPDLNVYLSAAPPDADAGAFDDDFVDLGDLKGNIGDQNYEVPDDVDLSRYSTVVIWCVRFSVAFGVASLG